MSSLNSEIIEKISFQHKNYPAILKQSHDPPKEIYIKGKIIPQDKIGIAIVGTRKCTHTSIRT